MKKPLFLVVLPCLLLSACGFTPMYGSHSPEASNERPESAINNMSIAMVPDREGQILRNELIDRFYHNGEPSNARYNLTFSDLNVNVRELDLTKSSEVTRSQIVANTSIHLVDSKTGEEVLGRSVSSVSSYNVLSSQFATRVTEENARVSAIKELARQIEVQLVLYFDRDRELSKATIEKARQEQLLK